MEEYKKKWSGSIVIPYVRGLSEAILSSGDSGCVQVTLRKKKIVVGFECLAGCVTEKQEDSCWIVG